MPFGWGAAGLKKLDFSNKKMIKESPMPFGWGAAGLSDQQLMPRQRTAGHQCLSAGGLPVSRLRRPRQSTFQSHQCLSAGGLPVSIQMADSVVRGGGKSPMPFGWGAAGLCSTGLHVGALD